MSVTEEGGSNSKGGTRKSLRLGSKKSENTSTNSPSKSGVDNKRKLDSGGLDIDDNSVGSANGATGRKKRSVKTVQYSDNLVRVGGEIASPSVLKGRKQRKKPRKSTESADAPAVKKTKVEEEVDEYNKYVSKLSPRQQKAEVTLGDVKKKAHELNNAEMEEALDNNDDPKDPTSLTQAALMVLSSSRGFYKGVDGGGGRRLAINPKVYKDGTDVEGATQSERIISNLRKYLTDPKNASGGSSAADRAAMMSEKAANGQGVNDRIGVTEKHKKLEGSALANILKSVHTKVKGHEVKGKHYTAVTVLSSPEPEIKASKNQNRPCLLLDEAGISATNRVSKKSKDTEEVKKLKNATSTLKGKLSTHIGMAQHPRNRNGGGIKGGTDTHPGDKHPWYNMKMTFFFKGQASKVGQYQQTVETPSKDEVAMLVDLAKKK